MFISNSHQVTHGAWSYAPNVIEVGGLNVKEAKPLPSDLQQILDTAPNGVILVSFGSMLDPSKMDSDKLQIFLNVFRWDKNDVICV